MTKPQIELAMIVRNGARGLARVLNSVQGAVERITIGDTGSTDNSIAIAKSFGANVIAVHWNDDYSAARNQVLKACTGDWILSLDDDEMLDTAGAAMMHDLAAREDVDAYELWKWNYIPRLSSRSGTLTAQANPGILPEASIYPAYTQSLNTLFFRRLPGVYFEYPVHETVSGRVRALGLKVARAPFAIHHFGYAEETPVSRQQKLERYHQLGLKKLAATPNDFRAHYELGLSELELYKNPTRAFLFFENAITLEPAFQPAWLYAGMCLTRLARLDEARSFLAHAAEMGPPSALLHEAMGDLRYYYGEFAEAREEYLMAGREGPLTPLVSAKLGAAEARAGQTQQGLNRIRAAVAEERQLPELYEIWVAVALFSGAVEEAAHVAARRIELGKAPVESFVIAAGLAGRLNQWSQAAAIMRTAVEQYPENHRLKSDYAIALERAA